MAVKKEIKGIVTAIITPFGRDEEPDENCIREVVDFQIKKGVNGLFPVGTTGEGPLMSISERKNVAEIIIDQVNGRIPVIVHTGSITTAETVELTKHATELGADGIGVVPPYYYPHDTKSLVLHYKGVVDATDLPVFIYNNPWVLMGKSLTLDQIIRLADEAGVSGIKDTSGEYSLICDIIRVMKGRDFIVMSGNSTIVLASLIMGADGAISSISNVIPDMFVSVYNYFIKGDINKAKEIQHKINDIRSFFQKPWMTALHEGLKLRGVDAGSTRRPLRPIEDEELGNIKKILTKYELIA